MKMYILVRDSVPSGLAINSIGHASLKCYLKYKDRYPIAMNFWLKYSFKKVTCKVSDEELEEAKKAGDYVEITESESNNQVMSIAFKPRLEYPENFSEYKLYQ